MPNPGPLERALENVALPNQATFKAQAMMNSVMALAFVEKGMSVQLAQRPRVDRYGRLEAVVESASVNGMNIGLDNPYLFVNPPTKVLVPGDDPENYAEDAWAAFKSILVEAIWKAAGH